MSATLQSHKIQLQSKTTLDMRHEKKKTFKQPIMIHVSLFLLKHKLLHVTTLK